MFKSSIVLSAILAGGLMFSGCSDMFDFEDEAYSSTSGNYAYCAYTYVGGSGNTYGTCTTSPSTYDNNSNYYGSCTSASYSYTYCSNYLDVYYAPSKAPGAVTEYATPEEDVAAYNAALPAQ